MIHPDSTLPPAKSIPNKFNIFQQIMVSLSVGLIVFFTLFYSPIFESSHKLIFISSISFFISFSIFLINYFIYIQKIDYINQWNLERDRLKKEKIKLKRRAVTGNLIFTMTALGNQGNSLLALTNTALLKQTENEDKSIIKTANIPILTTKNSIERYVGIIDHFLFNNAESISTITSNKQTKLMVLDNLSKSQKEYLIEKINSLSIEDISNQIQFIPQSKLNALINKQANLLVHSPVFLLGIQVNTETRFYSEAVILIELLSNSKTHGASIHQSPGNSLDYCIENVLSFGGKVPYAIENIWYRNIGDFELSQILKKLAELGISPPKNMINTNAIFGDVNELSDLLLISLALEQSKKNNLPQLILNTENMHNARIISNKNR
ncbi:hypothetical protein MMK73_004635 [Providencia rettgeri]|nr:hypothetical protein [Providencia rettgeri]